MHLNREKMRLFLVVLILCLLLSLSTFGPVLSASDLLGAIIYPDTYTANVGEAITWTAHPVGGHPAFNYYFEIYLYPSGGASGILVAVQGWDAGNTIAFEPLVAGDYRARVYVEDDAGTQATKLSESVTVTADSEVFRIVSLTADAASASVGDEVTWEAAAAGGTAPYSYRFYVYRNNILCDDTDVYGPDSAFSFTFTGIGNYRVRAYVRDSNAEPLEINAFSGVVSVTEAPVEPVEPEEPTFRIISVMPESWTGFVDYPIGWRVEVEGGVEPYDYRYEVLRLGALEAIKTQSYRTGVSSFSFTPQTADEYRLKVSVRDAEGTVIEGQSLWVEIEDGIPPWWNIF